MIKAKATNDSRKATQANPFRRQKPEVTGASFSVGKLVIAVLARTYPITFHCANGAADGQVGALITFQCANSAVAGQLAEASRWRGGR
jgi:hypothetical protein